MLIQNWTKSSRLVNDLECEICYQLTDSFFSGNPNSHEDIQNEKLNARIELPTFKRIILNIARTTEVENNEIELSNYYKSILSLAGHYKKDHKTIQHYFWLRLWLWQTEKEAYISFPCYDTLDEITKFFQVFQDGTIGHLFHDSDQSWQIEVEADDKYYYIKQTNPDDDDDVVENLKIKKEILEQNLRNLETRINKQIKILKEQIGIDFWTNRDFLNVQITSNIDESTKADEQIVEKSNNKLNIWARLKSLWN